MAPRSVAPGSLSRDNPMQGLQTLALARRMREDRGLVDLLHEQTVADKIAKREEESRKQQDAMFARDVEGATGYKLTPELEPYLSEARDLTRPEARVVRPMFGPPLEGGLPGGANIGVGIPQRGDILGAMREGALRAREESARIAERYDPKLAEEIKRGKRLVLPSAVRDEFEKDVKLRGEQAVTKEKEVGARIKETTEEEAVRRVRATTEKAESDARKSQVDAIYAEEFAKNKLELDELNKDIKRQQLSPTSPENLERLARRRKLELEARKLANEANNQKTLEELRVAYARTADPTARREILKNMSLVQGHVGALIADDRATQTMLLNAHQEATKLMLTLKQATKKGEEQPAIAASAVDAYNRTQQTIGEISNSQRVPIAALIQEGDTLQIGYESVPPDVQQAYISGELKRLALGDPQTLAELQRVNLGADLTKVQAQALHFLTMIQKSHRRGDVGAYEEGIRAANVSPEVAELALAYLQQYSSTITPKKPEAGGITSYIPSLPSIPTPSQVFRQLQRIKPYIPAKEIEEAVPLP